MTLKTAHKNIRQKVMHMQHASLSPQWHSECYYYYEFNIIPPCDAPCLYAPVLSHMRLRHALCRESVFPFARGVCNNPSHHALQTPCNDTAKTKRKKEKKKKGEGKRRRKKKRLFARNGKRNERRTKPESKWKQTNKKRRRLNEWTPMGRFGVSSC